MATLNDTNTSIFQAYINLGKFFIKPIQQTEFLDSSFIYCIFFPSTISAQEQVWGKDDYDLIFDYRSHDDHSISVWQSGPPQPKPETQHQQRRRSCLSIKDPMRLHLHLDDEKSALHDRKVTSLIAEDSILPTQPARLLRGNRWIGEKLASCHLAKSGQECLWSASFDFHARGRRHSDLHSLGSHQRIASQNWH